MGVKAAHLWVAVGLAAAFVAGIAACRLGYWALAPALLLPISALWKRWSFEQRTVTPNLMLIALPTVVAGTAIAGQAVCIAALSGMALASVWLPTRLALSAPSWILPGIGLAVVARSSDHRNQMFFLLVCATILLVVRLSASKADAITSLVDGVGVFLIVSLALQYAGFGSRVATPYAMDNTLTGGDRILFPLDYSQTTTPLMAAVFIAAVIPILLTVRRYRWLRLVAVAAALNISVLGDRRSALITALLLAACLLIPAVFRRVAPWAVGVALLTPFIYPHIRGTVGTAMGASTVLARRGENDPSSLNMRSRIWEITVDRWGRTDFGHQMFGYGYLGQAKSGLGLALRVLFGGFYRDPTVMTPHNSVLQLLFDGGLLLTGVFGAAVIGVALMLKRDLPGLAMLTALTVVGVTDVALSPSHAWVSWWVFVALGATAFSRELQGGFTVGDTEPVGDDAGRCDGGVAVIQAGH